MPALHAPPALSRLLLPSVASKLTLPEGPGEVLSLVLQLDLLSELPQDIVLRQQVQPPAICGALSERKAICVEGSAIQRQKMRGTAFADMGCAPSKCPNKVHRERAVGNSHIMGLAFDRFVRVRVVLNMLDHVAPPRVRVGNVLLRRQEAPLHVVLLQVLGELIVVDHPRTI